LGARKNERPKFPFWGGGGWWGLTNPGYTVEKVGGNVGRNNHKEKLETGKLCWGGGGTLERGHQKLCVIVKRDFGSI